MSALVRELAKAMAVAAVIRLAVGCPNAKPSLRVLVAYHGPLDGAEFEFEDRQHIALTRRLAQRDSLYLVHRGRLEHVTIQGGA